MNETKLKRRYKLVPTTKGLRTLSNYTFVDKGKCEDCEFVAYCYEDGNIHNRHTGNDPVPCCTLCNITSSGCPLLGICFLIVKKKREGKKEMTEVERLNSAMDRAYKNAGKETAVEVGVDMFSDWLDEHEKSLGEASAKLGEKK